MPSPFRRNVRRGGTCRVGGDDRESNKRTATDGGCRADEDGAAGEDGSNEGTGGGREGRAWQQ